MFAKKEISGIIIAGSGRFGCCLADQLNQSDEAVVLIDINCEAFNHLNQDFSGSMIEGDASNIETLREAGINKSRALIAATDNDNLNLMIAQIARDIYEVPIVIAIVNDWNKISVREDFDFSIVCPCTVLAQSIICDLKLKEG